MNKKSFFAFLTIRLLNLQFNASQNMAPNIIAFRNNKNNSVYLTLYKDNINVTIIKLTNACYNEDITEFTEDKIEEIVSIIKIKLKLNIDLNGK